MTLSLSSRTSLVAYGVFFIAALFALWNLRTWPSRIKYPGDRQGGVEGIILAETLALRDGVPIYSADVSRGFHAAAYGPLYYLLGSRLVDGEHPSYLPCRIVAALATLGAAAACGVLAFWVSGSWLGGVLAPLIYLGFAVISDSEVAARSDALALFLSFAAFLVGYRFRRSRLILLAVPLALASYFFKQQFVAGSAALFFYLLLEKHFRVAAAFAGLLAAGWLGLMALFQFLIFPRQNFARHYLTYIATTFEADRFLAGLFLFTFLALVSYIVGWLYLRERHDRVLACYMLSSLALFLVGFSRPGSGPNYLADLYWLTSVLMSCYIVSGYLTDKSLLGRLILLLAALSCNVFYPYGAPPRPANFVEDRQIQDYLRTNFSPRSEALSYCAGDLVRAGLDAPYTDLFLFSRLVGRGVISDTSMVSGVRQHRFAVILLHFDPNRGTDQERMHVFLPETVLRAIRQDYRLKDILTIPGPERPRQNEDRFYVFVPRKESSAGESQGPPVPHTLWAAGGVPNHSKTRGASGSGPGVKP
jgi:hypothetical protein